MFTETQILKRLIKNAWKGSGLHVEHTSEGWLAMGGFYWQLEIDYRRINNKVKAQLIELVGELPEPGEAYLYRHKEDPQSEIPGTTFKALMHQWADQKNKEYEITNVLLKTSQDNLAVLQCGDDKLLIPEWAADLVDGTLDEDENECGNGRSHSGDPYIYWANNLMALSVFKRGERYVGEKDFIDAVRDVDLCWDFVQEV